MATRWPVVRQLATDWQEWLREGANLSNPNLSPMSHHRLLVAVPAIRKTTHSSQVSLLALVASQYLELPVAVMALATGQVALLAEPLAWLTEQPQVVVRVEKSRLAGPSAGRLAPMAAPLAARLLAAAPRMVAMRAEPVVAVHRPAGRVAYQAHPSRNSASPGVATVATMAQPLVVAQRPAAP